MSEAPRPPTWMHAAGVTDPMYTNVVSLQYKSPTDAEEALKKFESEILQRVRKVPGFQRFHLVRTGEASTIHMGVFDTAADAEKGRTSVYPVMRDLVSPHLAAPPRVEHGEVRFSASDASEADASMRGP